MSHTILISNWLRTRKYSPFKQASKQLFFSSWSRSTSHFYALIGRNLTDEFMRKSYAASWNLFPLTAEADRVLCHLVIVLIVFFHLINKIKNSCYQDYAVIHGWFVYWVFGWEMRCQSKSSGIRPRMASFQYLPSLMRKRVFRRLKRFWPYLMAFRSCISTGRLE